MEKTDPAQFTHTHTHTHTHTLKTVISGLSVDCTHHMKTSIGIICFFLDSQDSHTVHALKIKTPSVFHTHALT